jgi:outer membrane protein OmpA-like peptidoglycan-associated protein
MTMNRRQLGASLLALALAGSALAQADNDAPVVGAPKIIEALSKDVVLDRPGNNGAPAGRRDASISLQVQFTFGSADLLPQGKRQLDQLAMALSDRALAHAAFELAGHTDGVGDAEANLRLSIERANSVKAYLTQAHGLSPQRLQTIGFGFSRLADPGNPAAAINRRVEVRRLRTGAVVAPQPVPVLTPAAPPAAGGRLVPTPR